ncbi:MAG: hypothetical protein AAGH89_18605 [Verrucomicrobiota bacterium]
MILRCIQILIVLAWLGSTSVLIQRTYFPDEKRYPIVPVSDVLNLFFDQGGSTDLAILQGGKLLGRMNVNPRSRLSNPPKPLQDNRDVREVFFSGFLTEEAKSLQFGQLSWNGSFYLDDALNLVAFKLGGRVPELANGYILVMIDPPELIYEIRQGREVVLSSNVPEKTHDVLSQASEMLGNSQLEPGFLENADEQIGPMIALLKPQIECRHGQFKMFGDRYDGFIVSVQVLGDWKLRLYFSELGELLKVDGISDLLILGEAFVPQDLTASE